MEIWSKMQKKDRVSKCMLDYYIRIKRSQSLIMPVCLDICNAVSRGDIEQAIEMCKEYDPYFFDQNEILLFRLHCRLFLGMVKKIDQERIGTQRMDVDILPEVPSANKSKGKSKQYAGVKRRRNERDQRVGDVVAENNSSDDTLDFQRILEFGNELKYTYAQLAETNPKIKEEMEV